jgi:tRNA(fMet)-specific endonuclease VapC
MPGGNVLFDTNAFIAWSFEDPDLAAKAVSYATPTITLVSLGELVFGAMKSARPGENRARLDERLSEFALLSPDRETANLYGKTCFALRRKGRPIPDNDIWIAALALQHRLPISTRDTHFSEVDGLEVVTW